MKEKVLKRRESWVMGGVKAFKSRQLYTGSLNIKHPTCSPQLAILI